MSPRFLERNRFQTANRGAISSPTAAETRRILGIPGKIVLLWSWNNWPAIARHLLFQRFETRFGISRRTRVRVTTSSHVRKVFFLLCRASITRNDIITDSAVAFTVNLSVGSVNSEFHRASKRPTLRHFKPVVLNVGSTPLRGRFENELLNCFAFL